MFVIAKLGLKRVRFTRLLFCFFLCCTGSAAAFSSQTGDIPTVLAQAEKSPEVELPSLPLPPVPAMPEAPAAEEKIETDAPLAPAAKEAAPELPAPPPVEAVPSQKSQPFGTTGSETPPPFKVEEEKTDETPATPELPPAPTPAAETPKEETYSTCREVFSRMAQCVPGVCQQDTPKGTVTFRLSGLEEEFCRFSYTLPAQIEPVTCKLTAKGQEAMALGMKALLETGEQSPDPLYAETVASECQAPATPPAPAPAAPENTTPAPATPPAGRDLSLDLPQLESKKKLSETATKCDEFPGKLEQCALFKCQELAYDEDRQDFIKTRTISGEQEGLCQYQETLPDNFTLNCNLSKKNSENFASYFRLLKTPEKATEQPDTITLYYDTMESACKVTGDDGKEMGLDLYFSLSNLPSKITEFGSKDVPEGDCQTLNEKLKTCEPFYCKGFDPVQEKFFNRQVEIERKIISQHDGTCYYLEQKPGSKPQGCWYSAAQSSTASQCSVSILLQMTKIEGMFAKTAAEQAADLQKKDEEKKKPKSERDPALSLWKPKLKALPKLNYKTEVLPQIIYKKQYDKQNNHLPHALYEEDYGAMAFDALMKGDIAALRALTAKLNEVYAWQAKEEKATAEAPKKKSRPRNALEIRDTNGNTLLIRSIMEGRYSVTRMLLGEGANPNAQNNSGSTALHAAAYGGRLDIVNLLLDGEADPNVKDRYGRTALSLATDQKHYDIVQVLLSRGGNPNLGAGEAATPLMAAISQNNTAAVRQLLRRGAAVNAADMEGQTALMLAASMGQAETVDLLLNNGANIFAQDRMARTAEMYAAQNGHAHIARHLASIAIDVSLGKKTSPKP